MFAILMAEKVSGTSVKITGGRGAEGALPPNRAKIDIPYIHTYERRPRSTGTSPN